MKKFRFSETQTIAVLQEHETGVKTDDLCRKHGTSSANLYPWKSNLGGLEISDIAKMRALEEENLRLARCIRPWRAGPKSGIIQHALVSRFRARHVGDRVDASARLRSSMILT